MATMKLKIRVTNYIEILQLERVSPNTVMFACSLKGYDIDEAVDKGN